MNSNRLYPFNGDPTKLYDRYISKNKPMEVGFIPPMQKTRSLKLSRMEIWLHGDSRLIKLVINPLTGLSIQRQKPLNPKCKQSVCKS